MSTIQLSFASTRTRKKQLLRKLFNKTGSNFTIEPNFFCDYGYNISFGENFYINHNCVILDAAKVTFGNNVLIGPNCAFYTPLHPLNYKTRNEFLETAKPITVGDNVWFAGNVVVLPGVNIPNNTVIGASTLVTKDITQENCLVFGNPAKIIRQL